MNSCWSGASAPPDSGAKHPTLSKIFNSAQLLRSSVLADKTAQTHVRHQWLNSKLMVSDSWPAVATWKTGLGDFGIHFFIFWKLHFWFEIFCWNYKRTLSDLFCLFVFLFWKKNSTQLSLLGMNCNWKILYYTEIISWGQYSDRRRIPWD